MSEINQYIKEILTIVEDAEFDRLQDEVLGSLPFSSKKTSPLVIFLKGKIKNE